MHVPNIEFGLRKPADRVVQGVCMVLFLALMIALRDSAQSGVGQTHSALPQPIGQGVGTGLRDTYNDTSASNARLLRALNVDRQKEMVADTDKLVRLVNELNDEIARTNPQELSPSQLHKVAEIEKLAHSVKEKMSTPVEATPAFHSPKLPRLR